MNNGSEWSVWHKGLSLDFQTRLRLNNSGTPQSGESFWGTSANQTVDMNADTFSVGSTDQTNSNNDEYVAYLFADTPGKIKCGTYTGANASQEIDCGFRAGWVMIKCTNEVTHWVIYDAERFTSGEPLVLYADESVEEAQTSSWFTGFTDNGFTLQGNNPPTNLSPNTYMYIAIAEDVIAPGFGPTGTLASDANTTNNTITLTESVTDWGTGGTVVKEGVDGDSTLDSPIGFINEVGDVVGNYATWNPLTTYTDPLVLSNGNLTAAAEGTPGSGYWKGVTSTLQVSYGKWYSEFSELEASGGNHINIGINPSSRTNTPLQDNADGGHYYNSSGYYWDAGSQTGSGGTSYTAGDVIGVAVDMDGGTIQWYKNGTLENTAQLNSNFDNASFQFALGNYTTSSVTANFGQKPWAYAPPAGYKSFCLTNF